ncbi:MAG: hypothetical protein WBA51_14860 [Erythrobacter sp.]
MPAPITYTNDQPHWHKQCASDVVLGMLMSRRPDEAGTFRIPAFAEIHTNLTAAFPAEAGRFAELQGEFA